MLKIGFRGILYASPIRRKSTRAKCGSLGSRPMGGSLPATPGPP